MKKTHDDPLETDKILEKFKEIEGSLAQQGQTLGRLESMLSRFQAALEKLEARVDEAHEKNTTTCEDCAIEFDLFAHHYSIGLFDNIVYVKCPRCQRAFPVDPKGGVKKE